MSAGPSPRSPAVRFRIPQELTLDVDGGLTCGCSDLTHWQLRSRCPHSTDDGEQLWSEGHGGFCSIHIGRR